MQVRMARHALNHPRVTCSRCTLSTMSGICFVDVSFAWFTSQQIYFDDVSKLKETRFGVNLSNPTKRAWPATCTLPISTIQLMRTLCWNIYLQQPATPTRTRRVSLSACVIVCVDFVTMTMHGPRKTCTLRHTVHRTQNRIIYGTIASELKVALDLNLACAKINEFGQLGNLS